MLSHELIKVSELYWSLSGDNFFKEVRILDFWSPKLLISVIKIWHWWSFVFTNFNFFWIFFSFWESFLEIVENFSLLTLKISSYLHVFIFIRRSKILLFLISFFISNFGYSILLVFFVNRSFVFWTFFIFLKTSSYFSLGW